MSNPQALLTGGEPEDDVLQCATPALNRHLVATDPGYKSRRLSIQQFNRALRRGESLQPGLTESLRGGHYNIPVVIHVVYHTAEQNISDAQIDSQITVLNADFNAANADLVNLPSVFQPLVGNAHISFYRARRNPQGGPTDGVTRTETEVESFNQRGPDGKPDARMKSASTGGKDAWPSDRYLNIWVCDLGTRLLGYAQFPGGLPATDGVVINFICFGTMGTARPPTNVGRNATHEVGHWLDCFHIWGDDDTRCSGTDHCNDTPNQGGPSGETPTFPQISCNNGPNGDLFYNHMDYTGHANRIMFTKGQVARMHATLTGARASFAGSDFFEFVLQTGTALHETDDTFKFLMADMNNDGTPDLVAIKKSGTGTNSTEVHVLSGASGFQTFITHTGTGLHETSTTQFDFALTDWNGDGTLDLVAIKKNGTGTNSTEVHILSGASNFSNFILQTGTALHETDDTFAFAMGRWNSDSKPDLFAIKKSKTDSNTTEVHILSGASEFKTFILQTGTGLHETDATFEFAVTDWNADGRPDLVAIKKSNTSNNSTEVHVLSGASNYRDFILHSETALHSTNKNFEFAVADWTRDGRPDLVAIKKKNTGTNSTEVHIMAG
ncbi:hypothetical protein H2198_006829 [Neophaeococcomyces mojaviensis]|uniref:Uncharacterized protein n=1 Tax=Neophaeococcomyces mojaviensis TaxID=3383035 RepID=A0ACC3A267_9EURO|nr:hypothetical protein H2198_006829 [Knufia sp. JES_112]